MLNNVATSPELSGVTYVQGSRGIWGMPHMLRMADVAHLEVMAAVLNANEQCLRVDAHEMDDRHGDDSHVNVWVALTGPAALAGRLFRYVCKHELRIMSKLTQYTMFLVVVWSG